MWCPFVLQGFRGFKVFLGHLSYLHTVPQEGDVFEKNIFFQKVFLLIVYCEVRCFLVYFE